jgi:protein-tyrosine-phosphatase
MAASAEGLRVAPTVVFVCRADGGRSAVARLLTEYYAGDRIVAIAPALEPVDLVRPEVVRLLADLGADTEPTGPAWLSAEEVAGATVAVIAGRAERCAYVEGAAYRHWPLADPPTRRPTSTGCSSRSTRGSAGWSPSWRPAT